MRKKTGPFILGVAGGTASGKTSVCRTIMEQLNIVRSTSGTTPKANKRVITISQDSFYMDLKDDYDKVLAMRGEYNFDHPRAFDNGALISVLKDLREGKAVKIPQYDFRTNCRMPDNYEIVEAADVIMVEGILIFYDQKLRDMFDMKVFVDCDADTRLARRVERDIKERGRNLTNVINQYLRLVKPAFEEFCLPTKVRDIIIPRGADNVVAIDLIVKHIEEILRTPSGSPPDSDDTIATKSWSSAHKHQHQHKTSEHPH